ncbi:hypothetical protein HN789_04140 [archaeon]|jgi:ribosomal protein S18 acetylase RimI-like enzyme|nr:hypothetical protein [archaeon]MBT3720759.1 hypothetical protein [archaeon]MBT4022486.1 hypothetical protein [archaeon]MBT4272325.1 hypothetical protein [archaeon]MBT4460434.1 hypothetical protein [archaeon]
MLHSKILELRPAKVSDMDQIMAIHSDHLKPRDQRDASQGFLVGQLNASRDSYYVLGNGHKQINGYICLLDYLPEEFVDELILNNGAFLEEEIIRELKGELPLVKVHQVAIHQDFLGQGLGKKAYSLLQNQFPNLPIYAFVCTYPVINERSLEFHRACGFEEIGEQEYFKQEELYAHRLLRRAPKNKEI